MLKKSFYWFIFVLIVTVIPGNYIPEVQNIWSLLQWDKLVHIFLFSIFSLFLINDFRKQNKSQLLQNNSVIFALLCGIVLGLTTELIQLSEVFHRNSNIYDFIADIIGTIIGIPMYYLIYKKKYFRFLKKIIVI